MKNELWFWASSSKRHQVLESDQYFLFLWSPLIPVENISEGQKEINWEKKGEAWCWHGGQAGLEWNLTSQYFLLFLDFALTKIMKVVTMQRMSFISRAHYLWLLMDVVILYHTGQDLNTHCLWYNMVGPTYVISSGSFSNTTSFPWVHVQLPFCNKIIFS